MTWQDDARCAQPDVDPEVFFPKPGENGRGALLICAACPVSQQCLDEVLGERGDERVQGIWGGTTFEQRKAYRAAMSKVSA